MDIRPVDLPILRREVLTHLWGVSLGQYERAIRENRQTCYPISMAPAQAARFLVAAEEQRLKAADLYFVSKDMTSLARVASRSLPEFTLLPDDLPSKSGLIYWDEPIAEIEYDEGPSYVVAASWSHWLPGGVWNRLGAVWVTWYVDRQRLLDSPHGQAQLSGRERELFRSRTARLLVDNESQLPFSQDQAPVYHDGQEMTFSEAFAQKDTLLHQCAVLKTTWTLMKQDLASVEDAVYDRPTRRRVERLEKEVPPVRVITLRHSKASAGNSDTDREYHHRWIVKGHWRQQWYPSRGVHRPVWIAPHIKGPEGAPLIGGEKVYAWTR